jgi:iron complex transport system substrate-binding protein
VGSASRRGLKSEAGESPARSRHCDRGVNSRDATGAEALGRLGGAMIRESGDCLGVVEPFLARRQRAPGLASGRGPGAFLTPRGDGRAAARSAGEEVSMLRSVRRIFPSNVALRDPVARGTEGETASPQARRSLRARRITMIALVALLAAGCGDERTRPAAGPSSRAEDSAFPATVGAANGKVEIERRPERIVSLSATATEMLFAIGAGDQVVAADEYSNYPPEAPTTNLSGLEPNIEAIAKFEPDLVVFSDEPGDLEKSLEALDISVIQEPAAQTLHDTYAQIDQLGLATGQSPEAVELVASMRSEIDDLVAEAPDFEAPPTYYHELDQTYFSVTSETFIGQIYDLVGLRSIADEAKGAGSQYPQLSAEFIFKADPDIIFLADTKCCDQSAATVSKRPGWGEIDAVKNNALVELDDDIASRWGPRVVDYLRAVVEAVSELQPGSG